VHTDETIQRLNFGMFYQVQKQFNLHLIMDSLFHSFQIPLPARITPQTMRVVATDLSNIVDSVDRPYLFDPRTQKYLYANLATCASDESCQLKLALAKHTQIFKYTSMSHLREIWELIDQFIPSLQAPRKRHRKATAWQKWLQWWDIASYSEQSVLYDNLKKIHQTTAVIAQRLYFTTNSLHTYTRLNSARASQVDSILFRQQEALLNITEIALHVTNSLFSTQVTIAAYEHIHILLNRIKNDIHLLI